MIIAEAVERRRVSHEENIEAVREAFQGLLEQNKAIGLVPITTHVTLLEGAYVALYRKETDLERLFTIQTGIYDPRERILASTRNYFFSERSSTRIKVMSSSTTQARYQSRGLGSGLLLLSDLIIEDAVRRYPELHGKLVEAEIVDRAKGKGNRLDGSGIRRKKWTSTFAELLGYECTDPYEGVWRKVYTSKQDDMFRELTREEERKYNYRQERIYG